MNVKQICISTLAICLFAMSAWADSLELKNGSLIKGKYVGGTQTSITFQVGSSKQSYDVTDIHSLQFDSEAPAVSPSIRWKQPATSAVSFASSP